MDGISNVAMDGENPGVFINTTGSIENLAIDISGAYQYVYAAKCFMVVHTEYTVRY